MVRYGIGLGFVLGDLNDAKWFVVSEIRTAFCEARIFSVTPLPGACGPMATRRAYIDEEAVRLAKSGPGRLVHHGAGARVHAKP